LLTSEEFKNQYSALTQAGFTISIISAGVIAKYELPENINVGESFILKLYISNLGTTSFSGGVINVNGGEFISETKQTVDEIQPGQQVIVDIVLNPVKTGGQILAVDLIQNKALVDSKFVSVEIGGSNNILPTQYLIVGGLGLLCLSALAIGGAFILTRSRKPKHSPLKAITSQLPQTPISSSAEQIMHAIHLAKSKNLEEAFDILRSLVQSEPNNASAWFNLGSVLIQIGNYKDSEHCFSRAKQLGHPKADDALNWLKQKRQ
jgi:hypothetical protein